MSDHMNNDMILGEMRGQLNEVVTALNAMSVKFDALSREVIGLGPLAVQLASLRTEVEELKRERHRRDGAQGVMAALLRSPAVGWFVALAATAWVYLKGKGVM